MTFAGRQRQFASQGRRHRPRDCGHDQGAGAGGVDGRFSEIHGAAYQNAHAAEADQQRDRQAHGQTLGTQDEDLGNRHEGGDGGQHHGSDSGGDALLGPEDEAVVAHEDEERDDGNGTPLARSWRGCAAGAHPAIENDPGDDETHCSQKKGRDLVDANADREKCRSPNKVDDGEGQQHFPRTRLGRGFHGGGSLTKYFPGWLDQAHRSDASGLGR